MAEIRATGAVLSIGETGSIRLKSPKGKELPEWLMREGKLRRDEILAVLTAEAGDGHMDYRHSPYAVWISEAWHCAHKIRGEARRTGQTKLEAFCDRMMQLFDSLDEAALESLDEFRRMRDELREQVEDLDDAINAMIQGEELLNGRALIRAAMEAFEPKREVDLSAFA